MAKTNFLNAIQIDGYIDVFYVDPNEPIEGSEIRKNASIKSLLNKIRGKR